MSGSRAVLLSEWRARVDEEDMHASKTLNQECLGSEDIKFLKTFRRTFETMSAGKNVLPDEGKSLQALS